MTDDQTEGQPADDDLLPDQTEQQEGSEQEQDNSGDDAAAQADDDGQPPKPKKSAKERINELTLARREAERQAEYWREQAMRGQPAEAEQPATEPDPAQYEYGEADGRYIRDLARHEARQEFQRAAQEQSAAQEAHTIDTAWQARQAAFAAKTPDYHQLVIANPALPITAQMAEAIKTSDVGPDVAYHLAKNPAEAQRIAILTPIAQAREIGRLEARVAELPKPVVNRLTAAPDPPPQVRGVGGRFAPAPDTDDFKAFEAWARSKS